MVVDAALGIHSAGIPQGAWIRAPIFETGVFIRTLDVGSAARKTNEPLAYLAAAAVLVTPAQRLAHPGRIAALVAQTVGIRRADRRTCA